MKVFPITLAAALLWASAAAAGQWEIPLAGNAFKTAPQPGRLPVRDSKLNLRSGDATYSTFFRVDRPATLTLSIAARAETSGGKLNVRVKDTSFTASILSAEPTAVLLGTVAVERAGYVRVDLEGLAIPEEGSLQVSNLLVESADDAVVLDYVRSNRGNLYYWGRRGPSVHLSYAMPKGVEVEYAYSELTVPKQQDPIGSYFMANGFAEGYFGIQVNGPSERRVLFSVWSPYRTDNPDEVPESDRVETLAKGDGVDAQDFGNEGSGGQSYLVYPWKAGTTYRFLTRVKPDGNGNTRYTSWFSEKSSREWKLIASFRRPKTDTHLKRFHSFLENFNPVYGHRERSAAYGNQWVRDTSGSWHPLTTARFTGDATARGRHRLDYAGGVSGADFFLRNGGFFASPTPLDQTFSRQPNGAAAPAIDFDALPRGGE